jgi:hypothetical protein
MSTAKLQFTSYKHDNTLPDNVNGIGYRIALALHPLEQMDPQLAIGLSQQGLTDCPTIHLDHLVLPQVSSHFVGLQLHRLCVLEIMQTANLQCIHVLAIFHGHDSSFHLCL